MMDRLLHLLILLILSATVSNIRSQYISPDPSFAVTGGNTTLTCHHPSHSNATVSWIKGDPNALGNGGIVNDTSIEPSGSSLFISSFRASELSGKYMCIVDPSEEEDNDKTVSCPAEIRHAYIQSGFNTEPRNTTIFTGGNVVLQCRPRISVPLAVITWTHNGLLLNFSSESRKSLSSLGNLYILNASTSDQGQYRCIATNTVTGVHRRSHEATLEVNDTSKSFVEGMAYAFTIEPENITVTEGNRLVLECAGQGYPQPREAWEKHQSPVLPDGIQIMATGELIFENVSRSHSGIFICRLRDMNSTEVAIKQILVTVKVPPHFIATPPSQVSLERGSNYTVISCSAQATDSFSLYIVHNGVVLHRETGDSPSVHATVVPPLYHVDPQTYQCIATDSTSCIKHDITVTFIDPTTPNPEETTPTPTTVYLTPEGSGATMEPEPTLDIQTSASIVASVGEQDVQSECIVTVSNDEVINVLWLRNGVDLEANPIEGVTVQKSVQNRMVTAFLTFDTVLLEHAGSYTCQGTTATSLLMVSADITLTVHEEETPPPTKDTLPPTNSDLLDIPMNIRVNRTLNNDLLVSWGITRNHETMARGFKISWDIPERIDQSARESVPIGMVGSGARYTFTIAAFKYDPLAPLKIYLWAYNNGGDGPLISSDVLPVEGPTTPTTPSVGSTTSTPGSSSSTTTTSTSTPLPMLECSAEAISPTSIRIEVPAILAGSSLDLMAQCAEAESFLSTTVDIPSSSSHVVVIHQALPGCSYTIELRSIRRLIACGVRTPSGQVDIQATVYRYPNGTVLLAWTLPPEIRESEFLSIEVNWGRGWVPVTSGLHAPSHFEPEKQYQAQLRFRHRNWEGILTVTIPTAQPETTESDSSSRGTEIALLYSLIFGGILIGCALLLVVILGLKYVQWSRRDVDKVTNYREKSKEEFERMSINRSSMNSIKSSKI